MAMTFQFSKKEGQPQWLYIQNNFINVNGPERILSAAAGGLLFCSALKNVLHSPLKALIKTAAGSILLYRGITGHCPLYEKLDINTAEIENINIKTKFLVNRPRAEVYTVWRQLENLPLFMRHLESVEQKGPVYSRWKAKLPGNIGTISWNAEIVEDKDYFIGWQSLKGSDIFNAGKVEFRDAPGGTEIQAAISYKAPAGAFGTQIARLLNPVFKKMVEEDISNFKDFIENDGIVVRDGETVL